MALERVGVLFKVKNPKNLVMNGKLAVTKEMMKRWLTYDEVEYKGKKYVEVDIGLFKNNKGGSDYYPIMEFLPGSNEGSNEPGDGGKSDDDLPF